MQKNVNLTLPKIKLDDVTIAFLNANLFNHMGEVTKRHVALVLDFLKNRCTYGNNFEIDFTSEMNQLVEQVSLDKFNVDAVFSVYIPGNGSKHQFSIAICQTPGDDDGAHIETNAHSYPDYLECDIERNRQLFKDGGKNPMDMNLFTSLRALLLGLASSAKRIYLHSATPVWAYNVFVLEEEGQSTRFVVSYESTHPKPGDDSDEQPATA